MKAYVLEGVNDLRYKDIEYPKCPKGWVIVKIKAAGICSSDIPRIFTKGTYNFPTICGHEFAGIVDKVVDEENASLIGKHVGVFPLIPCRNCHLCEEKLYEMCNNYDYLGSRRDGGFAEYVAVPVWNLVMLDESITFSTAAMLEPISVALHAIKLGVHAGDSVGVIGTGMIGIVGAQWTKTLGANDVTIIGRSESKRKIVEDCNIPYLSSCEELNRYDFVLEAVGTPQAIEQAISIVKPGGRIVLMGNPSGDIMLSQNVYWKILRKQISLCGTWNSAYDGANPSDWTEVINALKEEKINVEQLITHRYNQDNLLQGLELMRDHKEPYCKVMSIWNE